MRRFFKPFYLGVATAGLCLVAITIFAGVKVMAIDNLGPDKAEYGGANAYYELSNTPNVVSTTMMIPFYFPTRPTSASGVSVSCGDGSGNVRVDYKPPAGGALVGIDVDLCNGNFSIPVAAFSTTADPNTGYFEADVVFSLTSATNADWNYRAFRLSIGSTGLIGYSADSSNGSHFGIANLNRCDPGGDNSGCNEYFNYTLPFAPPCTQASGSAYVKVLDPDNPSGSAPYGIQPKAFGFKIVERNKKGVVTDSSVGYTKTVVAATSTTQELDSYKFNFNQGYNYQLVLTSVYANNVIQFGLPFDSINYNAPCLAGNATGASSAGCAQLNGYIYDKYNHSAIVDYYIAINPVAGDPQTTYSSAAALTGDLDIWTSGAADDNTPAADTNGNGTLDLYGHGFTVNTPPHGYRSHRYAGPWQPNTYVIYGREQGNNTVRKIDTVNVGVCAKTTCNATYTNFATPIINQPVTFHVWQKANNYADAPLPDPAFTVRVDSPSTVKYVYNTAVTAHMDDAANQVYSDNVTFTPTESGTYTVYWSWNGVSSGCSTSDKPGYAPYFSVQGGNIAAGSGFGNGVCTENSSADITSWNTNATPFAGAGTTLGALATGTINNFVSGLGQNGGANSNGTAGHGLSFANRSPSAPVPPDYGGQFTPGGMACVHNYAADATGSEPTLSGLDNSTAGGIYKSGSITLGDGTDITIGAGKTITLYVTGDAYIKSSIRYGAYSLSDVPRFNLYVTGNIYIDPGVVELHGVYVAQKNGGGTGGSLVTCSPGFTSETQDYTLCGKPLLFVGAVAVQNQLKLDRTHGSLAADPAATPPVPAEPAEIFQYSPELWLNASSTPTLDYKAFTSLPPVL